MSTTVRSTVQPFPFASLDGLTRADVALAARLRRFARAHVRLESIAAALGELLGARVEISLRRMRRLDGARGADDSVGVVVAPSDHAGSAARRVLVEVEGALGATLASRALQQRAPRIIDATRIASPALAGAVAAVLSSALRRAHAGTPLTVVAAGPGASLANDLAAASPFATTAWLTVIVGDDAFDARVSVPDEAIASDLPEASLLDALLSLGDAPLSLPLVAWTCTATRADVAHLAPGDAFVVPRGAISASGGALRGAVDLVAAASERGLGADLAEGGRLVIRGLSERQPWDAPMPEQSQTSSQTSVQVLEDAPVVVRVELGAVELRAREWAELGPGDVLTLGRRLGDPATLRVGGVEVARGELVSVDGEYGVRILARGDSR